MESRPSPAIWLLLSVLLFLAAAVPGCVISPRRFANNNSISPTPTPTGTPTPGVPGTPTPTATPTPTPFAMAAAAPSQFLFTSDPNANLIIGFRINSDGGLSPIPGSPFSVSETPRQLISLGSNLIMLSDKGASSFAVSRETGAITPTAAIADREGVMAGGADQKSVFDVSRKFFYVLDPARAEISAFAVHDGQAAPLSRAIYRAAPGANSLVVVKP